MTFYVENDTEKTFPFDAQEILEKVALKVLEKEKFPYEPQVYLLITDGDSIKAINKEHRDIDKVTDVLSFPNMMFDEPGKFGQDDINDITDPESGEVVLGDIIICYDKVYEQAEEYGHSILREFAFLVAHSMLHLCGYDHMTPEEAAVMEEKQRAVLDELSIKRD